jgi:hypothetical protein
VATHLVVIAGGTQIGVIVIPKLGKGRNLWAWNCPARETHVFYWFDTKLAAILALLIVLTIGALFDIGWRAAQANTDPQAQHESQPIVLDSRIPY